MGYVEQLNVVKSDEVQVQAPEYPNDVSRIIKSKTDKNLADQGVIYHTNLIEMDDGARYWVTLNTIGSEKEREKDTANKRFPGSDILVVEGTAFTTKYGKFYKEVYDELAINLHRPSLIVGVQQKYDKYSSLNKTTDDMMAIHAFSAATYGFDQHHATSLGTSRGGMIALLIQKRAALYGLNVLHADSKVPCIPTPEDALNMVSPRNLVKLLKNEWAAIKQIEREFEEVLKMHDTLDVLTVRGLITQLKEAVALVLSNIAYEVAISDANTKNDVGHITVQKGDGMSFAKKWPIIYKDHPYMSVDVREGGGHSTCISKPYLKETLKRQAGIANFLHADPANRLLGGLALKNGIESNERIAA